MGGFRALKLVVLSVSLVLVGLVAAAVAQAQTPASPATLDSVTQDNRYISASWTLGSGTTSTELDLSTSPDVDADGFFLPPIYGFVLLDPLDTTFEAADQLPAGTYYLQVISEDLDYYYGSNVVAVTLSDPAPPPPPVVIPPPPAPIAAPVAPTAQKKTTKKCKKGYKKVGNKCKKKKRKKKKKHSRASAAVIGHPGAVRLAARRP